MKRVPSKKAARTRRGQSGSAPSEAKLFMTGRSQAVRLPKEYRFTGDSVYVRRLGNAVVLTPKAGDRFAGLFAALDEFPRDFQLERHQEQSRDGLKNLFAEVEE
jgi:antitoxin VapB